MTAPGSTRSKPPSNPARRGALAARIAPAAIIALVAVWELVATVRAGHDVPDPDAAAWRDAAAFVRERQRPGELIVFAPRWIDPVGRLHLGDRVDVAMAARMDAARYPVIWELSVRGARAAETRGARAVLTEWFGAVRVRRYEQPAVVVVTDFVAELAGATVDGTPARKVEVALEEVGFAPHRCVRAVPRPGGSVRVTYPGARLGTSLVGYVGLADVFTRRDVRAPGRLEVAVGDRVVATREVGVDDGWVRFEAATEPGAATVTFTATAVGARARDRLICFAAEARVAP